MPTAETNLLTSFTSCLSFSPCLSMPGNSFHPHELTVTGPSFILRSTYIHTFIHTYTAFSGVLNGDFVDYEGTETSTWVTVPEGSQDLTGWTMGTKAVRIKSGDSAWGSVSSVSGSFFTCLHSPKGGSISTLLTDMQIGSLYSVTWNERDRPTFQSRALAVKIGGCEGVDISSEHTVPDLWETKQATFVATATSTVLCFISSGGTEDGSVFLDAIAAAYEGTKT